MTYGVIFHEALHFNLSFLTLLFLLCISIATCETEFFGQILSSLK